MAKTWAIPPLTGAFGPSVRSFVLGEAGGLRATTGESAATHAAMAFNQCERTRAR